MRKAHDSVEDCILDLYVVKLGEGFTTLVWGHDTDAKAEVRDLLHSQGTRGARDALAAATVGLVAHGDCRIRVVNGLLAAVPTSLFEMGFGYRGRGGQRKSG